jgi:hypothetical protein
MRDTWSEEAKTSIQGMLDKFLDTIDNSDVAPVEVKTQNNIVDPGPVPVYVPIGKDAGQKKAPTH